MKRIITLVALCLPLIAFAQIEKGKSVVSGNIGFVSNGTKFPGPNNTSKSSTFTLNGTYAYLISDRWAIGIAPSLELGNSNNEINATKSTSNKFGVGPLVRRYFALGEKFFINVDGMVAFSWQKDTNKGNLGSVTSKQNNFGIGIYPGITYLVTDKFALQASLGGISYGKLKPATGEYWSFSSSLGISSLSLGASWIF